MFLSCLEIMIKYVADWFYQPLPLYRIIMSFLEKNNFDLALYMYLNHGSKNI